LELPPAEAVFLKREDLSPIYSYKWRGAYNRMALLTPEERERGVVCASAGNHAQGVALAARHLGVLATIYMPISTPRLKQQSVRLHGGEAVEVVLVGDTYDAAAAEALTYSRESGSVYVHAYDDLGTMGGQGTLADEIVMSGLGPFDVAYLQIGGGGMAAAVACWLKAYYPGIHIVGVEGVDQASMTAAVKVGGPVTLEHVDVFCDGTAVKRAGDLTYPLCAELIDEFVLVTNEEVCAAIELLWEKRRCVAEPAGAMGLAGLLKQAGKTAGKRAVVILAGANLDFEKLAWISRHAGIGAARQRYYRFQIDESPGTLLHLLENVPEGINIIEVQYGKVDERTAWPVIGFEATPLALALLEQRLTELRMPHEDVTSQADVEFRIINYEPPLFRLPYFIAFDFPERPGALRDLLLNIQGMANICYFNYTFTGEVVGHALLGFEFADSSRRDEFKSLLGRSAYEYRELTPAVLKRILSL
ncbi:MAG: pyridoxal-phosphate dependent enzyme, partial [Candidatus Hydrogenedentes bacterium]|nr:pyridoxal-phosphate dependent enzyme [Candidatus Hydrogenedentota bacterium]